MDCSFFFDCSFLLLPTLLPAFPCHSRWGLPWFLWPTFGGFLLWLLLLDLYFRNFNAKSFEQVSSCFDFWIHRLGLVIFDADTNPAKAHPITRMLYPRLNRSLKLQHSTCFENVHGAHHLASFVFRYSTTLCRRLFCVEVYRVHNHPSRVLSHFFPFWRFLGLSATDSSCNNRASALSEGFCCPQRWLFGG